MPISTSRTPSGADAEITPVDRSRRLDRRAFAAVIAASASIAVTGRALAQDQTPPPIEPADGQDPVQPDEDEQDQEQQPQQEDVTPEPTQSSTSDDSGVILKEAEDGGSRYFALTGHNLETPFLAVWEAAGKEAGPGQPLSEQRLVEADGSVRQDFEGMAFVYDPAQEQGSAVTSVDLPEKALTALIPSSERGNASSLQVDKAFASTYRSWGGPDMFGRALSAVFSKSGVTSQVFQRAVFDRKGSEITLRKVNVEIAAAAYGGDISFAPAPPTLGTTTLVKASDGLRLREAPSADGAVIAILPDGAEFIASTGNADEWIPGYADGFSGWASREFLVEPAAAPELATSAWRLDVWQGSTISETNVRSQPDTKGRTTKTIAMGDPVVVVGWVKGEEVAEKNNIWAQVEGGGFVYSRNIVRAAPIQPPPLPPDAPSQGRWIDVHLTQQLITAYDGREPVRTIVTTTGQPGWETPPGWFAINFRVANETMDSGAIGAESFYKLENVLFTQYFTDRGHALHFAWWKTRETIGRPGSHGCLNLLLDDARFFWDWATVGTPVICRTT